MRTGHADVLCNREAGLWQRGNVLAASAAAAGPRHHARHQPQAQQPQPQGAAVPCALAAVPGRQGGAPRLVLPAGAAFLQAGHAAAGIEAVRHVPPRHLPQRIAGIFPAACLAPERREGEEAGPASQTISIFGRGLLRIGRKVPATKEKVATSSKRIKWSPFLFGRRKGSLRLLGGVGTSGIFSI